MKRILTFLIIPIAVFVFQSCEKDEPDCYEPISILTRNGFVIKEVVEIDSVRDDILVDTTIITYRDTGLLQPIIYSIDLDPNVIIYGEEGVTMMGVPLDPRREQLSFVLQADTLEDIRDTLTYFYQSSNHFISNACGFTNYFLLDSVRSTFHSLDSIALISNEVTSGNERHLLLYFF